MKFLKGSNQSPAADAAEKPGNETAPPAEDAEKAYVVDKEPAKAK